jgi:hypothetical protein
MPPLPINASTASTDQSTPSLPRWPLARVLMLCLSGAFFCLMCDLRIEHVEAVHHRSIAWMPILFSAVMTVACFVSTVWWNRPTKRVMVPLFALAILIGASGLYLHNDGQFLGAVKTIIAAWTDSRMQHEDAPPQLAPMAFCGLGAIGLLTCVNRFRS